MAFSWWFSRMRSSSKTIFTLLRTSHFESYTPCSSSSTAISETLSSKGKNPFLWWSSCLVPISAASLFLQFQSNPSFSDSHHPGGGVGGKESTEYVVKGSHRSVPQELIDDLKAICGENMTLDYDERFLHGKPQNSFHKAVNIPDIVVFPRSEQEVSLIVKSCNNHKIPIVPYGGVTRLRVILCLLMEEFALTYHQ